MTPGQVVTADDLKRAADGGIFRRIRRHRADPHRLGTLLRRRQRRYLEGEPGIDVPAAKWLVDQGIVAIGADNMAVEVLPNPNKSVLMPVHQFTLAECGVYLIENLALEELAADGVYAACLILLATKDPRCNRCAGQAGCSGVGGDCSFSAVSGQTAPSPTWPGLSL
jgi:kynurenine formamidase